MSRAELDRSSKDKVPAKSKETVLTTSESEREDVAGGGKATKERAKSPPVTPFLGIFFTKLSKYLV